MPDPEVAALKEHFIVNRSRLRDAAARILGCRQRAEDVVQDAFVKISEIAPGFTAQQPAAYLFRVVRNLAIDRHRRASFESNVFAVEEDGLEAIGDSDSPEAIMIGSQYLQLVSQALPELPSRTGRVFKLYRIDDYTQSQIANELAISTTLVNFMIRDAMNHCRSAVRPFAGLVAAPAEIRAKNGIAWLEKSRTTRNSAHLIESCAPGSRSRSGSARPGRWSAPCPPGCWR